MPLKRGKKYLKSNIKELASSKPGKSRAKAIKTLAKKWKISAREAKIKQAWIIARAQAKRK